VQRKKCSWAQI